MSPRRGRQGRGVPAYSRMSRVNGLVHEIVADALERIDDERLEMVTVMAVEVEPDLRHAVVLVSALGDDEAEAAALVELSEIRPRLQAAIGQQARIKWVPELEFRPDAVSRSAARIDEILHGLAGDGGPTGDRDQPPRDRRG